MKMKPNTIGSHYVPIGQLTKPCTRLQWAVRLEVGPATGNASFQLSGKRGITGMAGTYRNVLSSKQISGLPPREW